MSRKLTTEEFIRRAKAKHGDKYDYSLVKYIDNKHKVTIVCPVHGKFEQIAGTHLKCGCWKCAHEKLNDSQRFTKEYFVEKANEVHKNKYSYEHVEYKRAFDKVAITCPKHGDFWQIPIAHIRGQGCPVCKGRTMNTELFIERAKEIHGDKYNYFLVNYKDTKTKVSIICPKHGEFKQEPRSHLSGTGCPLCYKERRGDTNRHNNEQFIEKAKFIHGDFYDYSKVEYINCQTKVCIICPKHGAFYQVPNSHLNGNGCPSCKRSIGEEKITNYLIRNKFYFINQYMIPNEDLFCTNKKIYVDFYLPNLNLIIEFNGEQHYKPVKHFIKHRTFENQKERDISLKTYCKDHSIRLIEISYKELNKIEEILEIKLKGKRKKPNPQP